MILRDTLQEQAAFDINTIDRCQNQEYNLFHRIMQHFENDRLLNERKW